MKGTEILLTTNPAGRFEEVVIYGTPKPGTCLEIKAAALDNGRPTMQAVTRASGAIGSICVLLPDSLQGQKYSDAYVSGARGLVYYPVAGEELNMIIADVAGTGSAEDNAIGDLFGVQTNTGKLLANNSFASAPFQAMEARHGFITGDTWTHMKYLGNQA